MINKGSFRIGDSVVYPSHGVGKITGLENQRLAGIDIPLFVINFEKDKMSLRVPVQKAIKIGLRHLVSTKEMGQVVGVLQSRAKIARGMWSRRATEYETKINSGNLVLIAEVIRDLYKDSEDMERSYSERMIYESALSRLCTEYAVLYKVDFKKAVEQVLNFVRDKQAA